MKNLTANLGLGAVYISLSSPALAYLDGATGSMILQVAIGGIATAMFYARLYSGKIKNFFRPGSADAQQIAQDSETN